MKERKSTHITRKNYYLTPAERLRIREYIIANPTLTQEQVGDHFGFSRGTISNINREPRHKEYYENNIGKTSLMLLKLLEKGWRGKIVFSSTAAVYREFCADYGYKFDEATLGDMRSYAYQQFSKYSAGKNFKDQWADDARKLGLLI